MTRRNKKITAFLLAMLMVLNIAGTVSFAAPSARATDVLENNNQSSGIVLTKGATPNSDGSVDVTIEAFTTGKVTNTSSTMPTDILLVLDVSGSMKEEQEDTYKTVYAPVNGDDYLRYSNYWWRTFYGFQGNGDYYIKVGDEYIVVHKEGYDENRYDYYYSDVTNKNYYPVLNSSITPDRAESYEVVQFYSPRSELAASGEVKMTVMQEAVNKFIKETATKNAAISDPSKQHRISIIKFAGNSYYTGQKTVSGNTAVQNAALPENFGDNFYNNNTYNYTQVVKELKSVNSTNVDEFTTAVSNLKPGGATAVDYGMNLAEQVLYNRDDSDVANRKEVVIVFTDGTPTHGSEYSSSVAASAVNYASNLKKADTVIYSISMESHADASVLEAPDYESGNKFMHYLSSNFPNATASGSTIVPGDGSISSGYYMTPSADMSLEMIFDTIVHQIGAPTITLGEDAMVYDHISTYFGLETGTVADDVIVQTAARKHDGTWDTPQDANVTVSTENNNSTIIVSGFDFDENYISDTPRNGGNYGKKLIITIELKPDYTAIERHKEDIKAAGGWVVTNNGNALIEDTHDNIAAKVASPAVLMNKVTYLVDGKEYDYTYLMPSHEHTLISAPTKEGYTFSGWETTDVTVSANKFAMPEKDVTIRGTFTANEYKVTYKYNTDNPPAAWPAIPDDYNLENGQQITHKYGETVQVKAPLSLNDYTFVGWTPTNVDLEVSNNEFTMPVHDITFIAHFEPIKNGVEYKVEHYVEIIDGVDDTTNKKTAGHYPHSYDEVDDTSVAPKKFGRIFSETRKGTAGETEKIAWVDYHGYSPYTSAPSLLEGDPAGGNLVLKLYYTKNTNNVSYEYTPITGVTMPAAPVDNNDYYYGQTVTGATAATIPGYEFTGWVPSVSTVAGVLESGGTFPMPDLNIHFVGSYVAADNKYDIAYYQEQLNGSYREVERERDLPAKTGDKVSAKIKHFEGFHLNPTHPNSNEDDIVAADGSTVLKVYYDRETYTVSYAWLEPQAEYIANKYHLPASEPVKFGYRFTVNGKLLNGVDVAPDGIKYSFNGWYSQDINLHPNTDLTGRFEMPAHNVTIFGGFNSEAPIPTTTVTYDNDDPENNEPSQDDTETHEYIIVDPNDGVWVHNDGNSETTYDDTTSDAHAVLLMADHRVLEPAAKDGYNFIGWKSVRTRAGESGQAILSEYSNTLTNATVNESDVAYVYIAQYEAIPTPPSGGGGGGSIKYTLTYNSNGGTPFSSEKYNPGEVVEITKTPTREGYIFDGWHTNEGLTELVTSVTMNRNITVYAAWIKDDDEFVQDEDDIISPVPDMLNGDEHIAYVIGYEDGTVRPNSNITRAEVAAIFFRLLKSDIRDANFTLTGSYVDVLPGAWYTSAISTMSKLGILNGLADNKFAPNLPITRAEFAAICARFDDSEIEVKEDFTDISGHWAENYIHEAAARGWIKGYEDKTFRPNNKITRAEAMVLINRVLHRIPKTTNDLLPDMITWPDNNDKSRWYYIAIQEATNSHDYEHITDIYEKWTALLDNVDWASYQK